MTAEFTHHALIQYGYVAFGIGETAEDAREDARQWLGLPSEADEAEVTSLHSNLTDGALYIVPCTRAFAEKVRKDGGDLVMRDLGGGIGLREEDTE